MKIYELWYSTENGGDGSAGPRFFNSRSAAESHQEEHNKDGEGWAEDCSGAAQLTIIDGVINLVERKWIPGVHRSEEKLMALPSAPDTMKLLQSRFDSLIETENKYNIMVRESNDIKKEK